MPDPIKPSNDIRIRELERRLSQLERELRDARQNQTAARPQQARRTKIFPNTPNTFSSTSTHFLHGESNSAVRHKTKKLTALDANLNNLLIARTGPAILERDRWWLLPHLAAGRIYLQMNDPTLSHSNTSRLLNSSTLVQAPVMQPTNILPIGSTSGTFQAQDPGLYIVMVFGTFRLQNNTASSTVRVRLTASGNGIAFGTLELWMWQQPTGTFTPVVSASFIWAPTVANAFCSLTLERVAAGTTSTDWATADYKLSTVWLELGRNKMINGLTFGGGTTTTEFAPEAPAAEAIGSADDGNILVPGMGED